MKRADFVMENLAMTYRKQGRLYDAEALEADIEMKKDSWIMSSIYKISYVLQAEEYQVLDACFKFCVWAT